MNKKDATVTVTKDAQPNATTDFSYTTTGGGWSDFKLDDDDNQTAARPRHGRVLNARRSRLGRRLRRQVGHRVGPPGWSNTAGSCSEGTSAGSTVELPVDPGDTITCNYVNKKDATVTVTKDAQPNAAQDFAYTTTGRSLGGFSSTTTAKPIRRLSNSKMFTVSGADFGAKSVTESAAGRLVEHRRLVLGGHSSGSTVDFTVDPGDEITCTT